MKENAFLREVCRRMSGRDLGRNPLFPRDVQVLDGFRLGFMDPNLFASLCEKHGLNAQTSEAIFMQAECQTEPHVHEVGRSVFLPLGVDEGFGVCNGGTFVGPYDASRRSFELTFQPAEPGKVFSIEPGAIHFFTPGEGRLFSAVAFVSPRIQRSDGGFDIIRFGRTSIIEGGRTAVVEVAESPLNDLQLWASL